MKLKVIVINNHIALIDESAEIKIGQWFFDSIDTVSSLPIYQRSQINKNYTGCFPILFAEPELNLDVPVLPNWKKWEVEQLAEENADEIIQIDCTHLYASLRKGFITGYNHNKAVYTEEDVLDAWELGAKEGLPLTRTKKEKLLQSLKRFPKYIVMESIDSNIPITHNRAGEFTNETLIQPKLTTNSDGKQVGIIKELIW